MHYTDGSDPVERSWTCMKKGLCAAMIFLLLFAACAAPAAKPAETKAPEPVTSGDYTYLLLEDGTAELLAWTGDAAELEIPAEIDGIPVSSIGNQAFYSHDALEKVTVPKGVKSIGDNAFCGCKNLTRITLPDSLRTISLYAFSVLPKLEQITIPAKVRRIGYGAFQACGALTSVIFLGSPAMTEGNPFVGCNRLAELIFPEDSPYTVQWGLLTDTKENRLIAYLPGYGVAPNARKTGIRIEVPAGIGIIGDGAFCECRELTEVILPESVTRIERRAFYWCTKLERITIPESVTEIAGENVYAAFGRCDALTAVVSPGSYAETYCRENGIAAEN